MRAIRNRLIAAVEHATHHDREPAQPIHEHGPEFTITVQVTKDELDGGYIAEVVEFPGVASQGETTKEAVDNAILALTEVLTAQADAALERHDYVEDLGGSFRVAVPAL